jgi:3'(2'), 5'-bisphosphate nucleotidase
MRRPKREQTGEQSFEPEHIEVRAFEEIVRALEVETAAMLMDSQAKHAAIASGHADLLMRIPATPAFRDKIWDQAAGMLLVEEAGGRVTDLRGAALDFGAGRGLTRNEGGVIASNSSLHDAVLDAVRRVVAP